MTPLDTTSSGRNWRRWLVAAALALLWTGICWWQWLEHQRVRESARESRVQRGQDMAVVLETVIRATRRMHTVSKRRLQSALTGLANTRDLVSVALVSPSGQTVAQAGEALPREALALPAGSEVWTVDTLTLVEMVRLGDGPDQDDEEREEVMVVEGFRGPRPQKDDDDKKSRNERDTTTSDATDNQEPAGQKRPMPSVEDIQRFIERMRNHDWGDRGSRRYPPWMSEEQYREMFEKQGLRKFTIVLSIEDMTTAIATDRIQRLLFCLAALLVAMSLFVGWLLNEKALALRVDLLRASDMNAHLRELNASAAGLAHETRNPLNVVRGLARLIRDHRSVNEEAANHADTIMEEVDRINSRLDQFIAYSKPYIPNPESVKLDDLVDDVFGTLEHDREDHSLTFRNQVPDIAVTADEGLLRQVLFNLLLNACQAVDRGGVVTVDVSRNGETVALEVCDNGPGIPTDKRDDVFRPYVSLRDTGTGLGLAIVRQIAWAHRWAVSCETAELGGAKLIVDGLRLTDARRDDALQAQ